MAVPNWQPEKFSLPPFSPPPSKLSASDVILSKWAPLPHKGHVERGCGLITDMVASFQQQQAGELEAQTTTGAACDGLFQQIGQSSPWLRPEAEGPG